MPLSVVEDQFEILTPGVMLGSQYNYNKYIYYIYKVDRFEEYIRNGKEISIFGRGKTAYNYHYHQVECYKAAMWRKRVKLFSSKEVYGINVDITNLSLEQK